MPPLPFFEPFRFGTEIIYTLIIVILCFLIYLKTRESYNLTKHRGIKFFRNAFLFFGLAYAFRLLFGIVMFSNFSLGLWLPRWILPLLILLPTSYLSTMGLFYLMLSSVWKKPTNQYLLVTGHVTAIFLSIITFLTRSHEIFVLLQLALLVIAVGFSIITSHKVKKKFSHIKIIYILILIFWLINLWTLKPQRMFSPEIKIILQIISVTIFGFLYYRILKWTK